MADEIGLVVQRKDSNEPPSIVPAEFSNLGITLRATRGVVNKGIRIGSLAQFIQKYCIGLPKLGELGYYGIRELYNNTQPYGITTYPVRIVGDGATVASSTVSRGTTVLSPISTNSPFWTKVEAGTNAGTVKITLQDDYNSPTVTEVYDNLDDTNLPEMIDAGSALASVLYFGETLPHTTTGFVGGAKITATIGGGAVTVLTIVYGGTGYTGTVAITISGGNVGSSATDATATATVVNGVITGTAITDAGSGYTTAPTITITPIPNVTLAPAVVPTAFTVSAGQFGDPDPGKWANQFAYAFLPVPGNPRLRQFQAYQLVNNVYTAAGDSIQIDKDSILDGINDAGSGSGYMYIPGTYTDANSLPAGNGVITPLTGGTDESAAPVLADYQGNLTAKTGTYSFINCPVSMITSVDAWGLSGSHGIDYAEFLDTFLLTYKDSSMGIANSQYRATMDTIANTASSGGVRWRDILKQRSKLAAYKGWIQVDNEKGGKVWLPINMSVIGSGFVRKVFDETSLPSVAPGGQPAVISGIFAMDESQYTAQDVTYITKTLGFNLVILEDGVGYYPLTSRLMSTLNKNYDIHKERSINYHIDSFRKNLGFVTQEGNTPELRKRLISTIDFFEQALYNQGMFDKFYGYVGAVSIKCDSDNNPLSAVIQRKLYCLVSLRFVNIVETAFIYINNVEGTLNISTTPPTA